MKLPLLPTKTKWLKHDDQLNDITGYSQSLVPDILVSDHQDEFVCEEHTDRIHVLRLQARWCELGVSFEDGKHRRVPEQEVSVFSSCNTRQAMLNAA